MAPRTDFYRVTEGISGRFRGLYTDFGHMEFGNPKWNQWKNKKK